MDVLAEVVSKILDKEVDGRDELEPTGVDEGVDAVVWGVVDMADVDIDATEVLRGALDDDGDGDDDEGEVTGFEVASVGDVLATELCAVVVCAEVAGIGSVTVVFCLRVR